MEGRWSDAIDLMSRAEKLVHSPTHLLYLARAQEKLGKLVKAQESYLKITREKLAPNAPAAFHTAQKDAKKELEALTPRIPFVTVAVQGAGPLPVTVTMDGIKVPDALVGVPRPVDPGEHKLQAHAEGMSSSVSTISVSEGSRETVVLTLQPGGAAGPADTGEQTAPAAGATEPAAEHQRAETDQSDHGEESGLQ